MAVVVNEWWWYVTWSTLVAVVTMVIRTYRVVQCIVVVAVHHMVNISGSGSGGN